MSQGAKVSSVDALRQFRVALIKFADAAGVALGDAESDVQRIQMWLENEQMSHWQSQVRKRTEVVSKAKEAVRFKKVFKGAAGSKESVVDEEKALRIAERALEEAIQKLAATKSWVRQMQKEAQAYLGTVGRFATTVRADLPVAATKLDRMVAALEAYAALTAPVIDDTPTGGSSAGSAAMPPGDAPPPIAAPAEPDAVAPASATDAKIDASASPANGASAPGMPPNEAAAANEKAVIPADAAAHAAPAPAAVASSGGQ